MKLIRADQLIDGTGAAPLHGAAILIENDRIVAVGRAADIGTPDGAEIIDAPPGSTIMPGLIDVHVHLAYSGDVDPDAFRAESATIHYPAMALRAARYARESLEYGYTALRDMHAPGGVIIDLRDAINRGYLEGPRIKAPGLGLTVTGGHMDQPGFADFATFRDMSAACDGPDGFRKGVRAQAKRGADFIKINPCVGSRRDERFYRFEMTVDEITAACDEAHEQGLMVGAHTSGGPPLSAAIAAGCDTVEHAHWIDDATLELMVERGTFLVPTLAVNEASSTYIFEQPDAPAKTLRWAQASEEAKWERLTRAKRMGVKVAAGSDAGFFMPHGAGNGRELELLVQGGYSPLEAIHCATAVGADLMQIESGRLLPGKLADLLLVKGDPLRHISILRKRENLDVYLGGKPISRRLAVAA
ncbi:amidohydrolase family protein [Devosia aurantiaca]|uniref:Amidohydrolase family protein n=1 Tax=Devosia aurantiaca TaxID=2714858 RepID=A0A6M1SG33_9HYPH|nr:amidohydrolase family protein [Devosia aurantiaca]NGP18809.1 amidohydrolase family protein [Devosia aurantiaca]